jgi:stalled ribosome alternative rescue factor ArfA
MQRVKLEKKGDGPYRRKASPDELSSFSTLKWVVKGFYSSRQQRESRHAKH